MLSVTVKVAVQVALLPASSVAATVTVWVPGPTNVPAAGDWVTVIAPGAVQLSLSVTPPNTLGTAAWQFASALAPGMAEQITLGAVVSVTVKLVVQVALLPAASVAVTMIGWGHGPTSQHVRHRCLAVAIRVGARNGRTDHARRRCVRHQERGCAGRAVARLIRRRHGDRLRPRPYQRPFRGGLAQRNRSHCRTVVAHRHTSQHVRHRGLAVRIRIGAWNARTNHA